MTVATTINIKTVAGTGSTDPINFPYPVHEETDMQVYLIDEDGAEHIRVAGTHYEVDLAEDFTNCDVTPTEDFAEEADGLQIKLVRHVPYTQEYNVVTNPRFDGKEVMKAFDRAAMRDQQLETRTSDTENLALRMPLADYVAGEGAFDAREYRIGRMADAEDDNEATTLSQVNSLINAAVADASLVETGDTLTRVATVVALKALTPGIADAVIVNGYTVAGDGGGGYFWWDNLSVTADDGGMVIAPDAGGTGRWKRLYSGNVIHAKWYGVAWDGVANDTVKLLAAQSFINSIGGGILQLPDGTGLAYHTASSVAIAMASSVKWRGVPGYKTTLKLAAAQDAHLMNSAGATDIGLEDLVLDGNRINQSSTDVHCFRSGGVDGLYVRRVRFLNGAHYGFGLQTGSQKNVDIDDIEIIDSGADGFDSKNMNDDNENLRLGKTKVRGWGLSGVGTTQAAVDLRGPWAAVGPFDIAEPDQDDAVGIRMRNGELLDANGLGAHDTILGDFRIDLGTKPLALGLNVAARNVKAMAGGLVKGGFRAVVIQDSGFKGAGIKSVDAIDKGFLFDAAGSGLDGNDGSLNGCEVEGCGGEAFESECANVSWDDCHAKDCDVAYSTTAAASGTKISGGSVSGSLSANLNDLGSGTIVENVLGMKTKANLLSASLAIDSTGSKTFVINHGLGVTPALEDCAATLVRETVVNDLVIDYVRIDAVSSTQISGRILVGAASATVGATAKVAVQVRSKVG